MNRQEYLLTCLIEELSEVQKELAKCLRFTLHHTHQEYNETNFERLQTEWNQVIAIISMLEEEGCSLFGNRLTDAHIKDKIVRTKYYMDVSRKLGTLNDNSHN